MNRAFIHEDFLLTTPAARRFYHGIAEPLPVIDYHCHLSAKDLADDRRFKNITELWISGDPYKHRAMRIAGVREAEISGPAPDRAKFDRWAATVPRALGNPLHHWTALELARYFHVQEPLGPDSGERIWNTCNEKLAGADGSARALLGAMPVEWICTSDGLCEDLSHHARLAASGFKIRVLPSLRADELLAVDSPGYEAWLTQLAEMTGGAGKSWEALTAAVRQRLDAFEQLGCRLADHALDHFACLPTGETQTAELWERRLDSRASLCAEDVIRLKSGLLGWLGREYARRNWILQLHLGAQRATSSRLLRLAGPVGGFAGMGDATEVAALCSLLDDLEQAGALPRTILYSLNPALQAPLATLTGSFSEDGVPGKLQLGPAWWYNDHAAGIRAHLETLSSYGLLSTFIGMTTDSRSLLSMARHEYFRRILCDWIGSKVEAGFLPDDPSLLEPLLAGICHDNAARWMSPKQRANPASE